MSGWWSSVKNLICTCPEHPCHAAVYLMTAGLAFDKITVKMRRVQIFFGAVTSALWNLAICTHDKITRRLIYKPKTGRYHIMIKA